MRMLLKGVAYCHENSIVHRVRFCIIIYIPVNYFLITISISFTLYQNLGISTLNYIYTFKSDEVIFYH